MAALVDISTLEEKDLSGRTLLRFFIPVCRVTLIIDFNGPTCSIQTRNLDLLTFKI